MAIWCCMENILINDTAIASFGRDQIYSLAFHHGIKSINEQFIYFKERSPTMTVG